MSVPKRRLASGKFGLEANYISAENGTSTPTTAFTGQYVYCVQYNVVKCTVTSNVSGTITYDFSDDGVTSRVTVVDSVTGGTPYFRVVNVEDQYVRILWSCGVLPATFVLYTAFSKSSGGGLATSSSISLTGGSGISVTGAFPSWLISNLFSLTAGSGITISGVYPNLTISNSAMAASASYARATMTVATVLATTGGTTLQSNIANAVNSADWTITGTAGSAAATFKYTGVPRNFAYAGFITYTASATTSTAHVYLIKTDDQSIVYPTTFDLVPASTSWAAGGASYAVDGGSASTILLNTNDTITFQVKSNIPGNVSNFTLDFRMAAVN